MIPTRFILVRHGATNWTEEGRYQGWTDIPLNAVGKRQAECLAKRFKNFRIDVLYSSPLIRAAATAKKIAAATHNKILFDARLKEFGFGIWEGKNAAELTAARDPVFLKWSSGKWALPRSAESLTSLGKRIDGFLKHSTAKHPGKTVAVVAHGGVLKMMMMRAAGIGLKSYGLFQIRPASISVLDVFKNSARIMSLNDVCHLNTL